MSTNSNPYISPGLGRVIEAFLEALLPDGDGFEFAEARRGVAGRMNEVFDPARFDSPLLRNALPWIVRLMQWSPLIFFWVSWRPIPLTWMSVDTRRRHLMRMEGSRLYAARGLFLTCKLTVCMVLFERPDTWGPIGYDGQGLLPLQAPDAGSESVGGAA